MSASWIDPLDCCRYRSSIPVTFSHLMLQRRVVAALRCSLALFTLLMSACLMLPFSYSYDNINRISGIAYFLECRNDICRITNIHSPTAISTHLRNSGIPQLISLNHNLGDWIFAFLYHIRKGDHSVDHPADLQVVQAAPVVPAEQLPWSHPGGRS